jgi:myo-inositol catabolism protein IolS
MNYRSLGKSNIQVSEIGFGAWAIGGDQWGPVEDKSSISAMERAIELGTNFLDTADVYGSGHSETLVAKVLKGRRDQIVLSTKGGLMGHHRDPQREAVYDRPEKVIAAFDASLQRLETDYIDVYFCHLWWDKQEETEAFMRAFEMLKQEGKLRVAGVSANDLEYIKHFNRNGGLDAVQLDYSILNRSPEKDVLPYLQEHGIGSVIRGPLKMGVLTGKFSPETTFPEGDIRKNWPNEKWFVDSLGTVEKLRSLEKENQSIGQLALRYVLNHSATSVAIPGAKTTLQVEANAAASVRPLLSTEELQYINKIVPE